MTASRPFLRVAIAAAALALPSAALADALVVRASGPSASAYPVGRRLATSERIVLRAGDRITIVGEGPSRTLSGPGNFPVRATAVLRTGSGNTLGRYLNASGASIGRTGAVRAAPTAPPTRTRNLWTIDVAHSGPRCILDANDVTLFRSDMRGDGMLSIQNAANASEQAQVAFVAGQNFRSWPREALPIRPGVDYRVAGSEGADPVTISFIILPHAPQDAESAATMLADNGCTAQLADLGEELVSSGIAP